jgi:hypothetical protein
MSRTKLAAMAIRRSAGVTLIKMTGLHMSGTVQWTEGLPAGALLDSGHLFASYSSSLVSGSCQNGVSSEAPLAKRNIGDS